MDEDQRQEEEPGQHPSLPINVRHQGYNGRLYYVIIDAILFLTETTNSRRYWSDIKRKLGPERVLQLYDFIVQLKIPASDGKAYTTECADMDGILRIVQDIPSDNERIEHLKRFMAESAAMRIETIQQMGIDLDAERRKYRSQGYDEDWIEKRLQTMVVRKELTGEWDQRGAGQKDYGVLTNDIASGTFGKTTRQHLQHKGLHKGNLRDHMTPMELILAMLGEQTTTELHRERDSQGVPQLRHDAQDGGRVAGEARTLVEEQLGTSVVSETDYLTTRQQPSLFGEAREDDGH